MAIAVLRNRSAISGRTDVADGSAGLAHRVVATASPLGRGRPCWMWIRPSTPSAIARPADDRATGRAVRRPGVRMARQARRAAAAAGRRTRAMPIEPSTAVRMPSPTAPGSCHHSAALTTIGERRPG